jgi:hypothetical protein
MSELHAGRKTERTATIMSERSSNNKRKKERRLNTNLYLSEHWYVSEANVSEMHLKVGNWLALYLVPVILLPEVKTK